MVAAGFSKRLIRTALTLGEKLRRARKRKGVDLIEAELDTKIRAKYLEALENEDFDLLPNDVYVKGFLTTYAQYLGLPPEKIVKLYRQQKTTSKTKDDATFIATKALKEKSLVITPKLVVITLGILFCISAVIYIVFQVLSFASVPRLVIDTPTKDMVVEEENIKVAGITDPGVNLKVNKEPITVDSNGKFEREITLQKGLNTIVITATNKANKEASRVFVVERKIKTAKK